MRFHFIAKEKANFSICRMCKVLRVSESGYYAWVSRPASQRQRDDRVYLAHILPDEGDRHTRAAKRSSVGSTIEPKIHTNRSADEKARWLEFRDIKTLQKFASVNAGSGG